MSTWRKYFVAAAVSAAVLFCCQSAGAADYETSGTINYTSTTSDLAALLKHVRGRPHHVARECAERDARLPRAQGRDDFRLRQLQRRRGGKGEWGGRRRQRRARPRQHDDDGRRILQRQLRERPRRQSPQSDHRPRDAAERNAPDGLQPVPDVGERRQERRMERAGHERPRPFLRVGSDHTRQFVALGRAVGDGGLRRRHAGEGGRRQQWILQPQRIRL